MVGDYYPVTISRYDQSDFINIRGLVPVGGLYKILRAVAKSEEQLGVGVDTEVCLIPARVAIRTLKKSGYGEFARWLRKLF